VGNDSRTAISRREFARRAAIASAATFVPSRALSAGVVGEGPALQQPAEHPNLSAEGQSEADARYQIIIALYGSRFSDQQKSDLRHLNLEAQTVLGRLRADQLANSDDPALYLKPLVEREKKSSSAAPTQPAATPKP
jgi:hypothetical protein